MIFVTMLAAITLGGYLWNVHNTTIDQYAGPFINNHVPFNLYRNVLLPEIGLALLAYLAFLFINLYVIPHLLSPKMVEAGTSQISISLTKMKMALRGMSGKVAKKIMWLVLQILLIVFLLGTADNFATYFRHEWQFHYPGFSIFFNKNIPDSQMNIWAGYAVVFFSLGLYALYVCFREVIINLIEGSGSRKAFRTLICNQVTIFLVQIFLMPFFLTSFNLVHDNRFSVAFFSLLITSPVMSLLSVSMNNSISV
jgi:hypothetical protein